MGQLVSNIQNRYFWLHNSRPKCFTTLSTFTHSDTWMICSSGPPLNIRKLSYSNIRSDIDGIIWGLVSCPRTLQHAAGGMKLPPISGRPAPTLEPQPHSTFKTQVWKIVVKKVTRFICLDNKYSMYCSPFSSVIYLHSIQSHQQWENQMYSIQNVNRTSFYIIVEHLPGCK